MRYSVLLLFLASTLSANDGIFQMYWILNKNICIPAQITSLRSIGRTNARDPQIKTRGLAVGGTTWMLVVASTDTDVDDSTTSALEATGCLKRWKSDIVGNCDDVTGSVPCLWGERFYSRLPVDWGKDYSVEISTP